MSERLSRFPRMIAIAAFGLAVACGSTAAQGQAAADAHAPAPYEDRLLRLAEIIGSLHYLRNLCDPAGETEWRRAMEDLLDSETADEPQRRAQLTAGYNRGYRAFAAVHTACTDAAIAAEERYRREGDALTAEIVARFGN